MRKVGNVVSNQIYNPENKKPPVPVDADEADSAMERFIRQKYMHNVANGGTRKLATVRSDEGVPPPLPPKNSSKFSLRSATSLFPLASRSKKDSMPSSPVDSGRPVSHGSTPASRTFGAGASVNYEEDDMEKKLARLRDMGFMDNQRSLLVLKGVHGNLERAVESLIRLGEGDRRSPAPPPPARESSLRPSRSLTPLGTNTQRSAVGFSLTAKSARAQPSSPGNTSTNPFDMMSSPAQPQTAHSTGSLQNNNPYNQSLNPLGQPTPTQQTDHFTQAFQQLDISATQHPQQPQPLFPNRTGGLTPQAQNPPTYAQPPMAPSAPSSPQVYQNMNFQNMAYPHPSPLQQQPTGYNPFLANTTNPMPQHPPLPQQNLPVNTQQPQPGGFVNNPFARPPTRIASPTSLGQIPEQSQTSYQYASPVYPQAAGNNPFHSSPAQAPTYASQTPTYTSHTPTYMAQPYAQQGYYQPQRHDKASIMALYNDMPPAPQKSTSADAGPSLPSAVVTENQPTQAPAQPQRSMTQPLPQTTSNNPFMNSGSAAGSDALSSQRQVSRESVILGKDMAWTNGRHSPDAFASLSARHG